MKKSNGMTNGSKDDWIEFGKEEGENWLKNLANDNALQVVVNASDFDDAEKVLNRQDDYQYGTLRKSGNGRPGYTDLRNSFRSYLNQ